MKKKLIFLILLVFLIEIPCISRTVRGYQCNLLSLEVDKDSYYANEQIEINASWEIDYNPSEEYAFIQIKIYDSFDNLIWNSSEFDEIGQFTQQWSVNISQLNTIFLNYSNIVYIRFFFYVMVGEPPNLSFLEDVKEITIFKRIPLCQLYDFKDRITYGENLIFTARFYDDLIQNNSVLNNYTISFVAKSNNSITFQQNYTTNHLGIIEISLSSIDYLNIGLNTLIFKILQNNVYNDSRFQYEIFIDRSPVFIEIVNFKEYLEKSEDILIELYYYYFLNDISIPLINQTIELEILNDLNLVYTKEYYTDVSGVLLINLSHETLNLTIGVNDLKLILTYNGTNFLENKTISLNLNLKDFNSKGALNSKSILFITISIVSVLISVPLVYRYKKERKKPLAEIIIRY